MEQLAEELFAQAWETEPGERGKFLDAACAGKEELRRTVEQYLLDAELAELYFASPESGRASWGCKSGVHTGESEGDWIGPYKLLQTIGEGGFGVVWMAEQSKPIARRVAIKVIKAGMDTKEVLARFDAERQALARMEHPHIARVLDAGATPAGRSYFAMELVKGIPITSFCDEQKLNTNDRLALFVDVCAAVNHAHQKGVIHRDIKPSNVLVTLSGDKPVVKVIDFGIAKATEGKLTDGTLFTRIEQMVGTPMYMSPEQAGLGSLDIDTRSDIYSLGVLLYELLAGVPPFDQKTLVESGYEEMRRIIREVEPQRPSVRLTSLQEEERGPIADARRVTGGRLGKMIASDLDWIVMKAIDKSRERRYETADALVQDIGRFLADEPVQAKPPGRFYLLSKLAKRHRSALLVLTGFAILLVAATLVSSGLAIRATRAEQVARTRLAEAEEANMAKEKARRDAEEITAFMVDVFQRPNPEMDGRKVTVVQALEAAEKKLDKENKGLRESRVRLLEVMADTYENLGLPQRALELRRKALYERQVAPDSPDKESGIAKAMQEVIRLIGFFGYYAEARDMGLEQVAILKRQNAAGDENLLRAMELLAKNTFQTGEHDLAISRQRELWRQMRARYGDENDWTQKTAANLVDFCRNGRNETSPVAIFGKDSSIPGNTLAAKSPAGREKFPTSTLGEELSPPGNSSSVLTPAEQYEHLLKRMEQKQTELIQMRGTGRTTPRLMQTMSEIARLHLSLGDPGKAIEVQKEVVELGSDFYGETHPLTQQMECALAEYYVFVKDWDRVKAIGAEKARKTKIYGGEHAETLYARADILGYFFLKRFDEGVRISEAELPEVKKVFGPYNRGTMHIQAGRARCLAAIGRTREAYDILMETSAYMLDDTFVHLYQAGMQVWFGRMDDYEVIRTRLMGYAKSHREQSINVSHILDRNVLITCLAPLKNAGQGQEILKSLGVADKIWDSPICQRRELMGPMTRSMIRGIAEYRVGNFAKSIGYLEQSIRFAEEQAKHPSDTEMSSGDCSAVYLSMALYALGRKDEALGKIRAIKSSSMRPASTENPLYGITDPAGQVLVQCLAYREARRIIEGVEEPIPALPPSPEGKKSIFE